MAYLEASAFATHQVRTQPVLNSFVHEFLVFCITRCTRLNYQNRSEPRACIWPGPDQAVLAAKSAGNAYQIFTNGDFP